MFSKKIPTLSKKFKLRIPNNLRYLRKDRVMKGLYDLRRNWDFD
jgi:hypothetical protein